MTRRTVGAFSCHSGHLGPLFGAVPVVCGEGVDTLGRRLALIALAAVVLVSVIVVWIGLIGQVTP